jgi:AcrR family transcriptional regulator
MKNKLVAETPETDRLSWREQAVARSLDSARIRAESRVQRFLDAAIELLNSGSGKDFTVQEVVERSGQSLRSFYQYFGGKHELLLGAVRGVGALDGRPPARRDRRRGRGARAPASAFVVEYYRSLCPSLVEACRRSRSTRGRPSWPSSPSSC